MTTEQKADVEFCIIALVRALQREKAWLYDYGDAVIRDAIDRGRQADYEAALLAKDVECEALRKDAERPTNAVLVPADKLRELQEQADCEVLRNLLAEASKLLKRSPPAAMGMYVGRDKKSYGTQAKELAGAIDAALVAGKGDS